MKRWLSLCLLGLLILPVIGYFSLPFIAKNVVQNWLIDQGFQKPVFSVDYPSHRELLISEFSVEKHTDNRISTLSAGPVTISYDPWKLLLQGELTRIEIPSASLDIAMTGKAAKTDTAESDSSPFDLSQLIPDQWLGFAPAEELVIGELDVQWHGPDQPFYRFTGNIYLTQQQLLTRVLSSINNKALNRSDIIFFQDNRFEINMIDQEISSADPIINLTGLLTHDDNSIILQTVHSLDLNKTYKLAQQLNVADIYQISGISGLYSGSTEVTFAKYYPGNLDKWLLTIKAEQHNQLSAEIDKPYEGIGRTDINFKSNINLTQLNQLDIRWEPNSAITLHQIEKSGWTIATTEVKLESALNILINDKTSVEPFRISISPSMIRHPDLQITPQPISLSFNDINLEKQKAHISLNTRQIQASLSAMKLPAIDLEGNAYIQLPSIKAGVSVLNKSLTLKSAIGMDINLDKELIDAQWRIDEIPLINKQKNWRPYLPFAWPAKLILNSGDYTQSGHVKWLSGRLDGVITHTFNNVGFTQETLSVAGITINSQTFLRGERIDEQGSLHIDKIDAGIEINNIASQFRINKLGTNNAIADIKDLSGNILGGSFQLAPFYSVLNPLTINTDLSLRGLSLGALLRLEQQPGLTGEGILDGNLPLRYTSDGFYVTDGKIQARGTGVIRYRPDASIQALRESYLGLGIALDALSDFHYHELSVGTDYTPDGALLLNTRLSGNNPEWNNGQAVNFSMNIEENLLKLLETLQFTDKLTNTIEKRYRTP